MKFTPYWLDTVARRDRTGPPPSWAATWTWPWSGPD